jgi:hypothetical protein
MADPSRDAGVSRQSISISKVVHFVTESSVSVILRQDDKDGCTAELPLGSARRAGNYRPTSVEVAAQESHGGIEDDAAVAGQATKHRPVQHRAAPGAAA